MNLNKYEVTVRQNLMVSLVVEAKNADEARQIVETIPDVDSKMYRQIKEWLDDSVDGYDVDNAHKITNEEDFIVDISYEQSKEVRKEMLVNELMDTFYRNRPNDACSIVKLRKSLEEMVDNMLNEQKED